MKEYLNLHSGLVYRINGCQVQMCVTDGETTVWKDSAFQPSDLKDTDFFIEIV